MDNVVKAATSEQLAAAEVRNRPVPVAKQVRAVSEGEQRLELSVPVEYDGETYRTVTIRKLKGRDFLALRTMTGDEDISLLAIVTGLPAAVLEELDGDDFVALSEASQSFLPRSFTAAAAPTSVSGPGSQA